MLAPVAARAGVLPAPAVRAAHPGRAVDGERRGRERPVRAWGIAGLGRDVVPVRAAVEAVQQGVLRPHRETTPGIAGDGGEIKLGIQRTIAGGAADEGVGPAPAAVHAVQQQSAVAHGHERGTSGASRRFSHGADAPVVGCLRRLPGIGAWCAGRGRLVSPETGVAAPGQQRAVGGHREAGQIRIEDGCGGGPVQVRRRGGRALRDGGQEGHHRCTANAGDGAVRAHRRLSWVGLRTP